MYLWIQVFERPLIGAIRLIRMASEQASALGIPVWLIDHDLKIELF